MRTKRADDLAEQIAVLFGWTSVHAQTEREKALNQLWREWADERGGYLKDHRALTDDRIADLARQYDERHTATMREIDKLIVKEPAGSA